MSSVIYIPFPKKFYDDLVRFSDGRFDVPGWAEDRLRAWIDQNFGWDMNDSFYRDFGDRLEEMAEEYAPHALERWATEDAIAAKKRRPLVWKEVTIPSGSEVRMSYQGKQHYARVENEAIIDSDGEFSPSEWASKIAAGTSRNAWRDLWFKKPGPDSVWEPAYMLRQKARETFVGKGASDD